MVYGSICSETESKKNGPLLNPGSLFGLDFMASSQT